MIKILTLPQILDCVRYEIGECLGIETDDVQANSSFFTDMPGESIDVIDLMFQCERRFGVRIDLQGLMSELKVDSSGRLSAESIVQLEAKAPEINWSARVAAVRTNDPRDILTPSLISELIHLALCKHEQKLVASENS